MVYHEGIQNGGLSPEDQAAGIVQQFIGATAETGDVLESPSRPPETMEEIFRIVSKDLEVVLRHAQELLDQKDKQPEYRDVFAKGSAEGVTRNLDYLGQYLRMLPENHYLIKYFDALRAKAETVARGEGDLETGARQVLVKVQELITITKSLAADELPPA